MRHLHAFFLSRDGIGLSRRDPDGSWRSLDVVSMKDPKLREKLERMRRQAATALEGPFESVVFLPEEQVLYATVSVTAEARIEDEVRRSLDGSAAHSDKKLVWDGPRADGTVRVAAVAVDILDEAERVSRKYNLSHVAIAANPPPGIFDGYPVFGGKLASGDLDVALAGHGVSTRIDEESSGDTAVGGGALDDKAPAGAAPSSENAEDEAAGDGVVGDEPATDKSTGDEPVGGDIQGEAAAGHNDRSGHESAGEASRGEAFTGGETGNEPIGGETVGDGTTDAGPTADKSTKNEPIGEELHIEASTGNHNPAGDEFVGEEAHDGKLAGDKAGVETVGDEAVNNGTTDAGSTGDKSTENEPIREELHIEASTGNDNPAGEKLAGDGASVEPFGNEPVDDGVVGDTVGGPSPETKAATAPTDSPEAERAAPAKAFAKLANALNAGGEKIGGAADRGYQVVARIGSRVFPHLGAPTTWKVPGLGQKNHPPKKEATGTTDPPESEAPPPAPSDTVADPEANADDARISNRAENPEAVANTPSNENSRLTFDVLGRRLIRSSKQLSRAAGYAAIALLAGGILWGVASFRDNLPALFAPPETETVVEVVPTAPQPPESPSLDHAVANPPARPAPPPPETLDAPVKLAAPPPDDPSSAPDFAARGFPTRNLAFPPGTRESNPNPPTPREAEARYAATGVWLLPPSRLALPREPASEDARFAALEPFVRREDIQPLAPLPDADADTPLSWREPPSAIREDFDIDERGFVVATPEGALTPEGVVVFAGPPKNPPPLRGVEGRRIARLTPPDGTEPPTASIGSPPDPESTAPVQSRPPKKRPANLEAILERHRRAAPETLALPPASVQPEFPPGTAVARYATVQGALPLRSVSLIGVYGSTNNRRALVRLPSGKFRKVGIGDAFDGGKVSLIGGSDLIYMKNGQPVRLEMPSEEG